MALTEALCDRRPSYEYMEDVIQSNFYAAPRRDQSTGRTRDEFVHGFIVLVLCVCVFKQTECQVCEIVHIHIDDLVQEIHVVDVKHEEGISVLEDRPALAKRHRHLRAD